MTLPALPAEFVDRLQQFVPPGELASVLASFASDKPTAFRINPLLGEPEATLAELQAAGFPLQPVPWYPLAYTLAPEFRRALTSCPAFYAGRIYIQSLSSQLAPLLLAPQPGEEVLDLAAAPGGKTALMAVLMANQGRLAAVEPVKPRYFRLQANLKQQGVSMAHCYPHDGRDVGRKTPGRFDRVMLDAPCSSEARFSQLDPASWAHWSLKKVKETARKQEKLIFSAWEALKPGGILLYCTCAMSPEENEAIVAQLIERRGDEVEVLPCDLPIANRQPGLTEWRNKVFPPAVAHAWRVLPNENYDAFFLCRLRKVAR